MALLIVGDNDMYKRHVIAFIDILGFKRAIKDKTVDTQSIRNILKSFKSSESSQYVLRDGESTTITPNVVAFSDNIAITVCPSDDKVTETQALFAVLNHIHQAISCSIKNGLLVRGAITVGELYFENGMIFGPALIEAAELEKAAKYPRVIFSDESLKILNLTHYKPKLSRLIKADTFFFDHLGLICTQQLSDGEDVFRALEAIIQRDESNEDKDVIVKIIWLRQYYQQAKTEWERIKQQRQNDQIILEQNERGTLGMI